MFILILIWFYESYPCHSDEIFYDFEYLFPFLKHINVRDKLWWIYLFLYYHFMYNKLLMFTLFIFSCFVLAKPLITNEYGHFLGGGGITMYMDIFIIVINIFSCFITWKLFKIFQIDSFLINNNFKINQSKSLLFCIENIHKSNSFKKNFFLL